MSSASFDALGTDRDLGSAAYRHEDFPGCESFHLRRARSTITKAGWSSGDGVTETAWKVLRAHLHSARAAVPAARADGRTVAMLRGSRIVSFGSADLVRLDAAGRKRWLMQADEVLYLQPGPGTVAGAGH